MSLVIRRVSESNISGIHEVIESLIVRNFTIIGGTSNRSEKSSAGIAQHIAQGNLQNTDEMTQILKILVISDEEFYQKFKLFEVKRTHTILYLLRKIHNFTSDEMRILDNNQEIHIEHILLKTLRVSETRELAKNEQEAFINLFVSQLY